MSGDKKPVISRNFIKNLSTELVKSSPSADAFIEQGISAKRIAGRYYFLTEIKWRANISGGYIGRYGWWLND